MDSKMKFKNWDGEDLKGEWLITIKIDGVRCHKNGDNFVSRNGKPLYNIPYFDGDVAEIYCGSFKETITKTRTQLKELLIHNDEIFILLPEIDKRLVLGTYINPTKEFLRELLQEQLNKGLEGLILNQGEKRIKIKSKYSEDVIINGFVEGVGKFKNTLGALITDYGKVGTGFTNEDRDFIWQNKNLLIETYIEVEYMEKTEDNKFRHTRFIRLRPDK